MFAGVEFQTLDVISINLWNIVFSLLNLAILFLLAKFLFYKPVKKMLADRQKTIDDSYQRAQDAEAQETKARKITKESLRARKARQMTS